MHPTDDASLADMSRGGSAGPDAGADEGEPSQVNRRSSSAQVGGHDEHESHEPPDDGPNAPYWETPAQVIGYLYDILSVDYPHRDAHSNCDPDQCRDRAVHLSLGFANEWLRAHPEAKQPSDDVSDDKGFGGVVEGATGKTLDEYLSTDDVGVAVDSTFAHAPWAESGDSPEREALWLLMTNLELLWPDLPTSVRAFISGPVRRADRVLASAPTDSESHD